jgi:hypothetical protein
LSASLGEGGRFFAVSGSFSLWEKAGMRARMRVRMREKYF